MWEVRTGTSEWTILAGIRITPFLSSSPRLYLCMSIVLCPRCNGTVIWYPVCMNLTDIICSGHHQNRVHDQNLGLFVVMKGQRVQVSWMKEEIKIVPTLSSLKWAVTASPWQSLGEGNTDLFEVKSILCLYCQEQCTSPKNIKNVLLYQGDETVATASTKCQ